MSDFIRNFGKPTRTLEIVYKSGHVRQVRCTSWSVQWNTDTGQVISLTINGMKHGFVMAGIINIESIWEI